MNQEKAMDLISVELHIARAKFPKFNSAHEGYAIILEELDELQAEVFLNQKMRDHRRMRKEATHVAAMAIRFMIDVIEETE